MKNYSPPSHWFVVKICCGILAAVMLFAERAETHKPITSRYTYTEDVFPILNERCGACHVAGGVAPMSLLTYKDSMPWAEAIRGELMSANMPPWFADPGYGDLKQTHRLLPRELDVLMTWATGGAPQGPAKSMPAVVLKNEWKIGRPDLSFQLPADFMLPADKMEDTQEFVLARSSSNRWIRAADLLPSAPAIVRNARIYTRRANTSEENVLRLWLPGEEPLSLRDEAFPWPAGVELVVRIHYKKTWKYEGEAVTDRSTVGIYLSDVQRPRVVQSLKVTPSMMLSQNVRALAVRPGSTPERAVRLDAVRPDGSRVPMINLVSRPGWERTYWFAQPIALPRGTRIEMTGSEPLWLDVVNQD